MASSDIFTSPNAIPPRGSSSGGTTTATPSLSPAKSVLQPVPEASWLAHHCKKNSLGSSSGGGSGASISHGRVASFETARSGSRPTGPVNGGGTTTAVAAETELRRRGRDGKENSNGTENHSRGIGVESSTDGAGSGPAWTAEKEKIVMGPYDYMFEQPGKDIRRLLINGFNSWLKVPEDSLAIITRVVVMLHTASLLVDDVEDSSILRRGIPVANSIFGVAQTLNSANYVYFVALQELLKLRNNARAIDIYADELCNLHRGQGMDLYWRDTLTCPTEDDYLEMVGNKTGGLFRLAVKLMQAESATDKDCVPLVNLIGLIFQIRDDYLNLASTDYIANKGLCEDLTEGKFSFPILHCVRADPTNRQLLNILRQKTTDPAVKRYAVERMQRTGSFAHCRRVVRVLLDRAMLAFEALDAGRGEGEAVQAMLKEMALD